MTKEEFEKEYRHAEYRYAELKQYKKLMDNAEDIECKIGCLDRLENIHHIAVYKDFNAFIQFNNLSLTAQEKLKDIIKQDLEDRLSIANQKIEEINL